VDLTLAATVAGVVIGFLAGLLAFRVKCRWCPECGATTVPLSERGGQASEQQAHQPKGEVSAVPSIRTEMRSASCQ
jgi:hypothetical protein